jgi:hypothetical protein
MYNSTGVTILPNVESYIVSAPESLASKTAPVPWNFFTNNSRPSLLKGLNKVQSGELLDLLASSLNKDFHIPVSVGVITENAIQSATVKEPITKLVLIGASNLKKVTGHLTSLGMEVVDLCHPGWMATPTTVADLCHKLRLIPTTGNTAFVFDLFGNSVTRYELYDGTTSLPVKFSGGHHLLGDIVSCTDKVFEKLFEIVAPVLESVPGCLRILLPPSRGTSLVDVAVTLPTVQTVGRSPSVKRGLRPSMNREPF